MNRLYFWGLVSCSALVWSGCAESAVTPADDSADSDSNDTTDSTGSTDSTDSTDSDDSASGKVDAGAMDARVKDASTPQDARVDAATTDAGKTDSGVKDASTDAAKPDSGSSTDAGPQDAGPADSGTPPMCTSSQTMCDAKCVDTATDEANCGSCGNACTSGQTCENKQCNAPVGAFMVPANCTKKTYGGHGYGFCTSARNWADARTSCTGAGLDLAIISSQGENDFVRANGDSWIAANDQTREGNFVQVAPGGGVNGAAVTFTKWNSGQPDNAIVGCTGFDPFGVCIGFPVDEDCVILTSSGNWSDVDCGSVRVYVCETR